MDEPQTYDKATSCPDADQWQKAMDSEIKSLNENYTWELEELPLDQKPIAGKLVFSCKINKDGELTIIRHITLLQGIGKSRTSEKHSHQHCFPAL